MALLAHPPQPLHHHLGLHGITNDGDFFEQLTCTTSNYEPPRHYPSIHPAASSPSSGLVGSLQLNKQLPPLPSEDESDEIPTQPRGQATGVDRPAPQTTSLSIYPPPSPKSRNSASTSPETSTSIPDSNHFGTSMTSSFVGSPSSAAFSPLLSDSSSSGQAAQLPSELTEQSPSHLDAGLAESTMSPSSPALQLVTHNHTPLEEDPAFQLSSPVRTSLIANWDWDSSGPERSPVTEKKAHEPRQTWFVPNGNHHSSGIGRSHVMEDEPLVTILPTLRSSKSYPRRKCSLSGKPMPSVPPPLRRFQVPPSPSYPPQ
ncbi:hypothetical protein M407DRAFT_24384 [Tulasnella calospora MUT 4182]|uniref:Uncharacterized protein n=1 Tax=Tulasnella calospora MUT 4182 TaxID=1051891 RepID=A0A0C3QHY1_9AGAM|nr:hypothetical protein M407DRAFT_24384 [Tulasnella calospora MUT 4182]